MKRFRAGIAGTGFIADFHMSAIATAPGVEVAAVCDVAAGRAEAFARRWKIRQAFGSLDAMLAGADLDVVHVLTPPPDHYSSTLACLERCHVFLEKPAAETAQQCRALETAAQRAGRRIGVNHNSTWHPAFVRLVRAVQQRRLGGVEHVVVCLNVPLRQLNARQFSHWMFRAPQNIILEQGVHPLSQVHLLLGEAHAVSVLPSDRVVLDSGAPFFRTWQISLECERGTAQCLLSFGKSYPDSWVYAVGEDGTARADLMRNTFTITGKTRYLDPVDQMWNAARPGLSQARQGLAHLAGYALSFVRLRSSNDPFLAGFRASIGAFYAALNDDRPLPVDIAHGRAAIEACEAIMEAAKEYFAPVEKRREAHV